MDRNYYQILGVPADADADDIRATYVRLVKEHHPDTAGSLTRRLHDVQQAYRCLSDPSTRADHDRYLLAEERLHRARTRSIQRRLARYDDRHPSPAHRRRHRRRWIIVLILAIGATIAMRVAPTGP